MSPLFPESYSVVYPPKVGEKKIVTLIGEVERIQNPRGEGNYKDKNQKDLGYYDLIPVLLEDGKEDKMKMNTWKMYFTLKDSEIDIGDTIEIDHVGAGIYTITKK